MKYGLILFFSVMETVNGIVLEIVVGRSNCIFNTVLTVFSGEREAA